jgi:hypothetical protein
MNPKSHLTGKILYSLLFIIIIPIGLWLWARYTEPLFHIPIPGSTGAGWVLFFIGFLLLLWGMFSLVIYGKGLPMNAYPPPKYAKRGAYIIFRHPIYWGFGTLLVGFFIVTESSSGFWLVAPLTIMGMLALTWGYEVINLQKRFPDESLTTISDLPPANDIHPGRKEVLSSVIWILCLLFISNLVLLAFGMGVTKNFHTYLSISDLEYPYYMILSLIFVMITPFFINKNSLLRKWVVMGIIAIALNSFVMMVLPKIEYTQGPFIQNLSRIALDNNDQVFNVPLFLVFISVFAVSRQSFQYGIIFGFAGLILMILQLINIDGPLFNLILAILTFIISVNYRSIWLFLKNTTEKIANSWQEWEFGRVRVINHGFYVGFGAFLGILLAGILAGKIYAWAILVFAVIVIVFSALWAQIIEGSEKLKRPYGYYGALVGIIFASLAVWAMGANVWVIIGVISVFMPWIQAIGRLRCLVNGCCHGSKVDDPQIGIRYYHHRSRVCGVSGLKGEWLHPTPLYAILWLFFAGFVLLALWKNSFPPPFIFGIYLILTGLGRFVEEAYRGEVQTPILKGLRLYQWTAILSVLVGIFMTLLNIKTVILNPVFGWQIVIAALVGGLFTTFAMGVDFPYSSARFSRLV